MDEFDYEDGFDDLDPREREERDFAAGRCRECETWGEFQCRAHGDAYLEAARAEHEWFCLRAAARRGKRTKAGRIARRRLHMMGGAA